ncbi:MAG: metallophosphoesterase family protein, partial [Candidatus Binatia bacterium]
RHYREGYGKFLSDEQIAEIVEMYPYEILIGSHTHRPMVRQWGRTLLLNTGAVGAPFNDDIRAQYLVMTLKDSTWEWEFHAVPYDRTAALEAYEKMGYLPEGDLSAQIFRDELLYARPLYAPYWMWTEKQQRPRNWPTWRQFREHFPERFTLPPANPAGPVVPDRPGEATWQ